MVPGNFTMDNDTHVILTFQLMPPTATIVEVPDPHYLGSRIRILIGMKSLIRIGSASKSKFRSCSGSKLSLGGSVDQWSQIRITLLRIRSALKWKDGAGSAFKWCGSATPNASLFSMETTFNWVMKLYLQNWQFFLVLSVTSHDPS